MKNVDMNALFDQVKKMGSSWTTHLTFTALPAKYDDFCNTFRSAFIRHALQTGGSVTEKDVGIFLDTVNQLPGSYRLLFKCEFETVFVSDSSVVISSSYAYPITTVIGVGASPDILVTHLEGLREQVASV